MSNCHRIIQLTDLHLFADQSKTLLNVNTYDSFLAVLSLLSNIMNEKPVSLIVLTGDLSQDHSAESYRHCAKALQQFSCPIAWIPGNHDELLRSQSVLDRSHFSRQKHFLFEPWQIVLLNSSKKGEVFGYLAEDQLLFLKHHLTKSQDYALVMLHHHVLSLQTAWLDQFNLQNSEDFLKLIAEFLKVKAVVCGHVHMASQQSHERVNYYSTPSTSIQFKPQAQSFALDVNMPGLRILDLYENGEIITMVKRIPFCYQWIPNLQSKGY